MKNVKMFESFLNEEDDTFKKAVEAAQESFWSTIVEFYPNIKTGDFPPDATSEFDKACETALSIWLQANRPGDTDGH